MSRQKIVWVYHYSMVPKDCICGYCWGDGHDFEGWNECDACQATGLWCDHSDEDHQEMWDTTHPPKKAQTEAESK